MLRHQSAGCCGGSCHAGLGLLHPDQQFSWSWTRGGEQPGASRSESKTPLYDGLICSLQRVPGANPQI